MAFNSVLFIIAILASLYSLNLGLKYYRRHEHKRKEEIAFIIERIIDILQSSAQEEGGENFVVINHVRDMILPVAERKSKYNFNL